MAIPISRFEVAELLKRGTGGASPSHGDILLFDQVAGWKFTELASVSTVTEAAVTQHQAALELSFTQLTDLIANAQVPESAVTQHEAALSLLFTQLTDSIADAQVPQSAVVQHQAALSITESQISDLDHYNSADFAADLATKSTTDLAEGSNLYYTQGRFDTAFAAKTTGDLTEGANLYYTQARFDAAFAAKTTTDLAEGTNLYYTQGRFDVAFAAKTTTNLTEGSNLYYTQARFDSAYATALAALTAANVGAGSFPSGDFQFEDRVIFFTGARGNGRIMATSWSDALWISANLDYTGSGSPPSNATYVQDASVNNTGGLLLFLGTNGTAQFTFYTAPVSIGAGAPATLTARLKVNASGIDVTGNIQGDGSLLGVSIDAALVNSGTFASARISQASVTQHQAALSITESQISDLDHYVQADFDADFATAIAATPPTSLSGWPANSAGFLENDGAGNLTWGAGTGGAITAADVGAGTFPAGTFTFTDSVIIGGSITTTDINLDNPAGAAVINMDSISGQEKIITFRDETTGNRRWAILAKNNAESGSNSGSDFAIHAYNDAGISLGEAIVITRSNRELDINGLVDINRAGDGTVLLRFNTDRPWQFLQRGADAEARLILANTSGDKQFDIEDASGFVLAEFFTSDANPSVTFHGALLVTDAAGGDEILYLNHFSALGNPYLSLNKNDVLVGSLQHVNATNVLRLTNEVAGGNIELRDGPGSFSMLTAQFSQPFLRVSGNADNILDVRHTVSTGNPYVSFTQGTTRRGYLQWDNGVGFQLNAEEALTSFRIWVGNSEIASFNSDGFAIQFHDILDMNAFNIVNVDELTVLTQATIEALNVDNLEVGTGGAGSPPANHGRIFYNTALNGGAGGLTLVRPDGTSVDFA